MRFLKIKPEKIQGYMYVTEKDDLKLFNITIGDKFIKNDPNPPWLVVNHSFEKIIITKWPGRILKVEVLNQFYEKDLNKGLVKNPGYTRTLGVRILDEIPISSLFESNGELIVNIIDFTSKLTENQVTQLSNHLTTESNKIYSDAWNKWLKDINPSSMHLNENHSNTLAIFTDKTQSPINQGFSIISNIVTNRAKEILGDKAFTVNDDGEYILNKSWGNACAVLLHAAMAFGSRELINENDKELLLKPWKSVTNITY